MRVVISANSILHMESVMYISYYRQYPAYYMPFILCYWKILHNICFVADEVFNDGTQQDSTGRGYVIFN